MTVFSTRFSTFCKNCVPGELDFSKQKLSASDPSTSGDANGMRPEPPTAFGPPRRLIMEISGIPQKVVKCGSKFLYNQGVYLTELRQTPRKSAWTTLRYPLDTIWVLLGL